MHFIGSDQRHGFEHRPIGEFAARHPGVPELGGPRWQAFPSLTSGQDRRGVEIAGKGVTSYQWFDDRVTETACSWLRERAAEKNRRPFAAVVGYVLPHCPYVAPDDLFDYYYERVDIPRVEERLPPTVERFQRVRNIFNPPLPEERIRIARAAYFALCEYFDSRVGLVLDTLESEGLSDNTLVIYCSDHGEMAGNHGCWWKSNYYEGSVGVPLIARYPGKVPAGEKSDAIVNLMDIAPTAVDYAGAVPPGGIDSLRWDGRSLKPLLSATGDAAEGRLGARRETYSELVDRRVGPMGSEGFRNFPSRMIRYENWKLWVYDDSEKLPPALFNLSEDPDELHDLGTDPDYADIRSELLEKVYMDWNPAVSGKRAADKIADLTLIAAWGEAVRPECTDTLRVPPPEIEKDVELL
jgi:choline-sulfatase